MDVTQKRLFFEYISKLYGKESEIIQLHEQLGLERNDAAEIDNLIWYLSEIFKSEMKLALGPIAIGPSASFISLLNISLKYQIKLSISAASFRSRPNCSCS